MNGNTINNDVTMDGRASVLASRYRIIRQLGAGGMGSVWLAEDTKLDNKLFAIKMLPSILVANKRAYNQLKEEALLAMKLVHPNIVQIRAFEENDNNPFLVMDYIDGETLDDYLANRMSDGAARGDARPPENIVPASRKTSVPAYGRASVLASRGEGAGVREGDVVRLLKPIAEALDYAHSEGVVHRDIKPANIMIRKDGRPFVMDFGIAREIQETMTRMTGKMSSGTLMYMSPEQLIGSRPEKEQDVYSFAAMVYECLKGEPPFCRGDIEYQILHIEPEPLIYGGASVPAHGRASVPASRPTIADSVMAGLAKKPEDRPKSCIEVLGSGELNRVERVERAEVECAESDIDVGDSEAVNHTMHSSFKADNPIVPDSPLSNLDISNHKIRRKGVNGFWGVLFMLYRIVFLAGSAVSTLWLFILTGEWFYSFISLEFVILVVFPFASILYLLSFTLRLDYFFVKRTKDLLMVFSRGGWISAMDTKNVYWKDPFVMYYRGVGHLYIRQNYILAEKLFIEAAGAGVPEALIGLGWMAENGWGKPKNMLLAQMFYREAEEQMQKRIEDKK